MHLHEWNKLKHIAEHQTTLTRAINQTMIRKVRRSATYQFGYLIPGDYKHALELDKLNGKSRWYDATKKDLDQINKHKVFVGHGKAKYDPKSKQITNAPQGYQKIKVHLVFACKHDGRHKARLVGGGHLTPDPIDSIYSGVFSTRSLILSIFLAKLNNMKVWGGDIGNAYQEATTKDKLYRVAGPEFEELQGHTLVIHKALYGSKSSGLRWSQRVQDIMLELNFRPCKADPCVWLREMKDKYKYIAIYVDDLLIASDEPHKIIQNLKDKVKFKIKGDGPLEYHLGCDYKLDKDGTFSGTTHKIYQQDIRIIQENVSKSKLHQCQITDEMNYHPQLDNSVLCNEERITKYMSMIGQLQWAITLGRYDTWHKSCPCLVSDWHPKLDIWKE